MCVFLSIKYRNPYQLHYVFGKKGAGKSLFLVSKMLKYKRRGWNVYTDMADVNIPGVRIIKAANLAVFRPEPHSALFLDEVGITYDNRKFKSLDDGIRDFWKFLRKMKCCAYMNSQAYDIDKKIRDTVDEMYLLQSILGCITLIRPIKRKVTLVEATAQGESRIADNLKFRWILDWRLLWCPKYFKYFDTTAMPARKEISYELVTSPSGTDGSSSRAKRCIQLVRLCFIQLWTVLKTKAGSVFSRKNDDTE